jgi:hypothetical protein
MGDDLRDERLRHSGHAASPAFARTRNVTRSPPNSTLSTTAAANCGKSESMA